MLTARRAEYMPVTPLQALPYAAQPQSVPTPADLLIYQGDDYAGIATIWNGDGTAADITGWVPQAQIRRAVADADPEVLIEITCVLEPPNTITLSIHHDLTKTLEGGRYVWDLQLTSPNDAIVTVLAGRAIVTAEVTRDAAALLRKR